MKNITLCVLLILIFSFGHGQEYRENKMSDTSRVWGLLLSGTGTFYGMAVDILMKVVDIAPDRVVTWLNLADAYWGVDNRVEAQKCYVPI